MRYIYVEILLNIGTLDPQSAVFIGAGGAEPARGMRISCVRAGAGWAGLSSVSNAGKVPKRAPK